MYYRKSIIASVSTLTRRLINCSFYKEEMAGETRNYIYNRGWYEDKDPESVFAEIVDEITTKTQQIKCIQMSSLPID